MRDRDTPLKLVRLWPNMMQGCYEELDILAGAKEDETVWWPDYCRLPVNATVTYLQKSGVDRKQAAVMASELTACWMWRKDRIMYCFDRSLAEVLAEQAKESDDAEVLPAELLLHPPQPIVYIRTPGLVEQVDGFFYWVDYDITRKDAALRVQWVLEDMSQSFGQAMHITPGATLRACAWETIKASRENLGAPAVVELKPVAEMAGTLLSALQLVLYLAAENSEVAEEPAGMEPSPAEGTAGENIVSIADREKEVRSYFVGARIGAAIRRARADASRQGRGGGARKRLHSRRGHWHHYWTGPKDGQRMLILKWTAPTFIHANDGDAGERNVVSFPAKEGQAAQGDCAGCPASPDGRPGGAF